MAGVFEVTRFELDVVVHKSVYVLDVSPVVCLDGVGDAVEIYDELLRRSVQTG